MSSCRVSEDRGVLSISSADGLYVQAQQQHRKLLEAQESTSFPLDPVGDAAEVPESQRVSDEAFGHR